MYFNASLNHALDLCFRDQPLTYTILNKMVVIKEKEKIAGLAQTEPPLPNLNEPFFGNDSTYWGLTDFFALTKGTGLQYDIGNAFRNSSRGKADPGKVVKYLPTLGDRWVTSHLKTLQKGESQPVLTDNPPARGKSRRPDG